MDVLGQVQDRLHRHGGVGVAAPGSDLFGGDRARVCSTRASSPAGRARAASARWACSTTCRRGTAASGCSPLGRLEPPRSRICWPRARSPRAIGPAHLERLGASGAAAARSATVGDRDLEVQGVGQVQVARRAGPSRRRRPGPGRCRSAAARRPRPGLLRPARGRTWPWPPPPAASAAPARSCAPPAPRAVSTNSAGIARQAHGGLGDHPQPPRLQLPGLRAFPAVRQPVEALDALGQEPAPRLRGLAERGGELGDRELRDPRAPGPPSGRQDSCQVSTGPTRESSVCIEAYFAPAIITSRRPGPRPDFRSRA